MPHQLCANSLLPQPFAINRARGKVRQKPQQTGILLGKPGRFVEQLQRPYDSTFSSKWYT